MWTCGGWERWAVPSGPWPGHQDLTGLAGVQARRLGLWRWPAVLATEELNKYLLSVPSTGGRELLGLRAFISGALTFSLVGASGTEQVTTNISWLLPKEMSQGGMSVKKIPP